METGNALLRLAGLCLVASLIMAGILFPVAGGIGFASNQASETVNSVSADLVVGQVPLVSTITDKDGVPIAHLFEQNRFNTPPEGIADSMKAAIIAIEDRRFLEHKGVDWRATTRALMSNLSAGSALEGQGGSTLTMQYVKNYLLYVVAKTEAERVAAVETTPARKLREIRVALELEKQISKDELLARYLNIVFFGHNSYGVASAARTYFNTTPDRLTIAQAALLAGMVKSTNTYDPVDHPEQALARRNLVIDLMVDIGSITPELGAAAKAEPLGIQQPLTGLANGCVGAGPADGFYCQYALDYLKEAGFTDQQLRRGGYLIRTNLDRRASDLAKRAAGGQVPTDTKGIANAMAIVEPGRDKHRVRALVANRDYGLNLEAGQTSYALPSRVQGFGAGSIYKIFTAAAALERGLGINSQVPVPGSYTSRVFSNGDDPYTVRNAGNYRQGSVTLQTALAISPNTTFVALEDRLGSIEPVVEMAWRLGMRESLSALDSSGRVLRDAIKQDRRASYTLGPEPTSPLDLANVGATLMSGGVWCPPTPIDAMFDRNGNPVVVPEAPCEQAVPEGLANTLAVGLSKDDQPGGTAYVAAQNAGWTRPMLGKTGTTQNNRSAGFVGATPQYSGAVLIWPDGSRPRPICDTDPPTLCRNGNIFGGKVPARTWFQAMIPLHEGLPVLPMPPTEERYVNGGGLPVPNVVGQGENQARLILERAGFKVTTSQTESNQTAGTVVSQVPTEGALPGDTITLYISTGFAPTTRTTRPTVPTRRTQPTGTPNGSEPRQPGNPEPTVPTRPPEFPGLPPTPEIPRRPPTPDYPVPPTVEPTQQQSPEDDEEDEDD